MEAFEGHSEGGRERGEKNEAEIKLEDGLVYQKCPLSVMEKNRQRKQKRERKKRMKT